MNKILFKGKDLTNAEGYNIFEKFTNGLQEINPSSRKSNDLTYIEFEKDKNENTKVIVEAYYKENNFDIEYMQITEVTLPDATDFKNINTLKNNYIINWNSIPEQLQKFILQCDHYWMNLQYITLYSKDNKAVASIGISRWYSDIEVNSIGAGNLFQWNLQEGFTIK